MGHFVAGNLEKIFFVIFQGSTFIFGSRKLFSSIVQVWERESPKNFRQKAVASWPEPDFSPNPTFSNPTLAQTRKIPARAREPPDVSLGLPNRQERIGQRNELGWDKM